VSQNRLFLLLAVFAAVLVVAGSFFLGVQPQLAAAGANDAQRTSVEQRNAAAQVELTKLREENKTLASQKQALAQLQASIPSTASTSVFYRELDGIAASSGVTISSITTSDPSQYTNPGGTDGASAENETSVPMPATDPTITGADFSLISVTVGVNGTFDQARAFLKGVQTGTRLFLVTNITSSAGETDEASASSTWTFGGTVYVLADTTATPAATPSATATNG
jgi:Tfp pilus assembly protein PilO